MSDAVTTDALRIVWEPREEALFTILESKPFSKEWRKWRPRTLQLRADCTLLYRKGSEIKGKIDLSRIFITKVGIDNKSAALQLELGIHVVCHNATKKVEDEVHFRCILPEPDLDSLLNQLRTMSLENNIDALRQEAFRAVSTELNLRALENQPSVMRRAVAKAMDKFETRSRHEQILLRRGAFKFLPVLCDNDLIHGSWWFVLGSIYVVVSASITLANGFEDKFLGDDSSNLSDFHYRATWFLVLVSGIFFTLGSLAFVRAMHEPALQPYFPQFYHFQSDELLGSWLFTLGVLPLLPYCFIFLVEATTFNSKMLYLGCLVISFLLLVASCLFARACYPSSNVEARKLYFLPVALCCLRPCLAEKWIAFHLASDWLAGCWLLFWATILCTLACFVLMISAINNRDRLLTFIYATAWTENVIFTIGAAYFVSGSYPSERLLDEDVEDPRYFLVNSTHNVVNKNGTMVATEVE